MRAVPVQHTQAKVGIHEQATNPVETMQSYSLIKGCTVHTHPQGAKQHGGHPPAAIRVI